jgi:hypothetical protein
MALIAQSDLEAKLGRSLTADEANAFVLINAANQAYVEKMIGSSVESANESTRYYDGGVQHLKIDPCTAITAVKQVDDDDTVIYTYDTSDYTVEPRNKTLKTMIRNRSMFITGINNISVTAKFSIYDDTDILNIVKNAMLDALITEIDNSDNIKRESIEGYSVEFAETQTKNALESIKYLFPEVI